MRAAMAVVAARSSISRRCIRAHAHSRSRSQVRHCNMRSRRSSRCALVPVISQTVRAVGAVRVRGSCPVRWDCEFAENFSSRQRSLGCRCAEGPRSPAALRISHHMGYGRDAVLSSTSRATRVNARRRRPSYRPAARQPRREPRPSHVGATRGSSSRSATTPRSTTPGCSHGLEARGTRSGVQSLVRSWATPRA